MRNTHNSILDRAKPDSLELIFTPFPLAVQSIHSAFGNKATGRYLRFAPRATKDPLVVPLFSCSI